MPVLLIFFLFFDEIVFFRSRLALALAWISQSRIYKKKYNFIADSVLMFEIKIQSTYCVGKRFNSAYKEFKM